MNEGLEQWVRLNRNFAGPVGEWNKTTSEILRRIYQQNLSLLGEQFELLSDQCKRLSAAKKPEELISIYKDIYTEGTTAAMKGLDKYLRLSMESVEDFSKCCSMSFREPFTSAFKSAERAVEKTERHK